MGKKRTDPSPGLFDIWERTVKKRADIDRGSMGDALTLSGQLLFADSTYSRRKPFTSVRVGAHPFGVAIFAAPLVFETTRDVTVVAAILWLNDTPWHICDDFPPVPPSDTVTLDWNPRPVVELPALGTYYDG